MKKFIASFTLITLFAIGANSSVKCNATEIKNSSALEESFSLEQYPQVNIQEDADDFKVQIGSNTFSTSNGDDIKAGNSVGFDQEYVVTTDYNRFTILLSGTPLNRNGQLIFEAREDAESSFVKPILLASLKCQQKI